MNTVPRLTDYERVVRIINEVQGVKAQFGITSWEWDFLLDMKARGERLMSAKRLKTLASIERKVFEGGD